MIVVKSISNFDDKGKIIYDFFVSPYESAPTEAEYPLMSEGSTYSTPDTAETPAVMRTYVYTGGTWTQYVNEEATSGGGDEPTGGDVYLTSATIQWLTSASNDSGGHPNVYILESSSATIDDTYMSTNDLAFQITAYTPTGATGISIAQNGYYNRCYLVRKDDYLGYEDQSAWVEASCPVYIDTEDGDWYEFDGNDATITVKAHFGYGEDLHEISSTLYISTP